MLEIDLYSINFHQLLEEKSFILSYQIIKNEFDISLKIFADFRTNNFIFINIFCVIDAVKFFNITVICLSIPVSVTEYDDKSNSAVTHTIVLHFWINEWHQLDILMLILDLNKHDLIFRRKWFDFHNIWLNVHNQQLIWSENCILKNQIKLQHELMTSQKVLCRSSVNFKHQTDIDQRDQTLDMKNCMMIMIKIIRILK